MNELKPSNNVVESLKRALAWEWTEIPKNALSQIQQALRLAVADASKNLSNECALRVALERMDRMHAMMMEKVNHGASWYDAECLREMNEAPLEARRALRLPPETGLSAQCPLTEAKCNGRCVGYSNGAPYRLPAADCPIHAQRAVEG